VAQVVSATLLYRAGDERRETAVLTAAAFLLVNGEELSRTGSAEMRAQRRAERAEGRRPLRSMPEGEPVRPRGLPRAIRYLRSREAPVAYPEFTGEGALEERLRTLLLPEGVDPVEVAVVYRRAGDDPAIASLLRARPRFARRRDIAGRSVLVAAIRREPGGTWEAARVAVPADRKGALAVLIFQTLVILVALVAILYFVLRRITRPLAVLTDRVSDFSRRPDKAVVLAETGPSDTRRLIAAHNAMETRIAALLDEKDVMLGAIGHDLKTPLAALRVRIESVPDEVQRARMAATIEDITRTLDDILALARVGRGRSDADAREAVDIAALAESVVEEFEDLGEPATMVLPEGGPRLVARVQETWLKRALRNLVGNAVRYGGAARVSVAARDGGGIVLRVEDDGPGIPADRIADMLEPFTRGEASRNRATGGAGLGLTLARAIAEAHEGELVLENRAAGGLRAEIRLPRA
ncbi:MAG: HAMP domain-containing sensor histidine kinase, partial [Erythrobacter sp.]|jgi:signal transduction histidine kinase|nr:HAMP domain-containing sensor histidine kinase [Erythrobacter sp.]